MCKCTHCVFFVTSLSHISHNTGPRLRPIDKGGKELIKFYQFWQSWILSLLCRYLSMCQQRSESVIKVTKDFSCMHSLHHFTICHILVVIRFSYAILLCHLCQWVAIEGQFSYIMSLFFLTLVDGSGCYWAPGAHVKTCNQYSVM